MSSEYDIILACMQIARQDTGAGGLVPLTGNAVPLVRFFDIGHATLPVATIAVLGTSLAQGAPSTLLINTQFDSWVVQGSEGLDVQIIDRITEVMTNQNFKAEGLDVGVTLGGRRMLSDLEDGRLRMSQDISFRLTR